MRRLLHRLRYARDHRWVPGRSSDYLDDGLGQRDRARVRRHLGECPECRELVDGLRAVVSALGSLGADPVEPSAEVILASVQGQLVAIPPENA